MLSVPPRFSASLCVPLLPYAGRKGSEERIRKTRPGAFGLYIIKMGERENIGAHHPLNDKTL